MMKKNTNFYVKALLASILFLLPLQMEGQFLKKLQKHAEEKIEREAEKRTERKVDKTIDKGFDEIEETIDGKNTQNSTEKNSETNQNSTNQNSNSNQNNNSNQQNGSQNNAQEDAAKTNAPTVVWSKFDFIPGDEVIFEDGPSADEENGEFPSKWDLYSGNVEIAEVDGEKIIIFPHGGSIVPYLKNSKEDYLPEVFTIEFDAYFQPDNPHRIFFSFYDSKNQKGVGKRIYFYSKSIIYDESSGKYSKNLSQDEWRHFSIAVTKDKLKVYLNDERLINLPHMGFNPTGITFEMDGYAADKAHQYLKNLRIAKGGVKYYDRMLSDGKIVVNGIKFDTNKATLKAESMGPINEIYQLMVDNPTVNFSVEGHTDSDGADDSNMTLSKARGEAVMNQLIEMGVAPNRLKYTGFGESKPIDNNSSPEGKANNRRVEFVKFTGSSTSPSTPTVGSSAFDNIDYNTIDTKWESIPDSDNIPISNNSNIVNGKGTILIYATSDGNLGKMEIVAIDKNNNYKLTVKYVTYDSNGNIYSKSNNLEIPGTYTCDLDKGITEDVIYSEVDFHLNIQDSKTATLNPGEIAILKIYK
jgi:outer membrane protein OmpA-like peptidoglycan-associated protein